MRGIAPALESTAMALNLESNEAGQPAHELAAATRESVTEAVTVALRERLERDRGREQGDIGVRLDRLTAQYSGLSISDGRTADASIGYDDSGLPR